MKEEDEDSFGDIGAEAATMMDHLQENDIEVGGKFFNDKMDLYMFMVKDCGFYMPPLQYTHVNWIRDIITEKKKALKKEEMTFSDKRIPQIEGLAINDLAKFMVKQGLQDYLPTPMGERSDSKRAILKLKKDWLVHMC